MAYYSNNSRGRYNNGQGYQNFNSGNGQRFNNNFNQRPRKRTGASQGIVKGDSARPYVRGWRVTRMGIVTYFCSPYSKTRVSESQRGRQWENWMVKVKPQFGQEYITSGLYDQQTGRVIVSSEGIVINPKAANGGYCGGFGQKNNRR